MGILEWAVGSLLAKGTVRARGKPSEAPKEAGVWAWQPEAEHPTERRVCTGRGLKKPRCHSTDLGGPCEMPGRSCLDRV